MKRIALLIGFLLIANCVFGNEPTKIFKDSKSGVIYYEESDQRHIAAISSDGKLLWCCEVLKAVPNPNARPRIVDIYDGGDKLGVVVGAGGATTAIIDKKTGKCTFSDTVQ